MNARKIFSGILIGVLVIMGCQKTEEITQKENTALLRAKQTLDTLYANYSAPYTYLLRENVPTSISKETAIYLATQDQKTIPRQYSYLWPYSGTVSAVIALFEATQDTIYKSLLDNRVLVGLEEYFDAERTPKAYASYITAAWQANRYYDDNIWLGINFSDIYLLTKEDKYLQKALTAWEFIKSGMDKQLGGGIYWCEQKRQTKNTCSNAPASVLSIKLFQATQDSSYLDSARHLYEWVQTHLQDSTDYLYFDNIDLKGKINKTKYAYNSGQMMQAATLLYRFTGEKKYLTDAQNLAKGCHNYFFMDHTPANGGDTFKLIKKGDIWFTAVMLRGFIELYHVDKNKTYLNSFNQSLDYAWDHARDEKGLFNTDLSGNTRDNKRWVLTQAAMVEMYARLAAIE